MYSVQVTTAVSTGENITFGLSPILNNCLRTFYTNLYHMYLDAFGNKQVE